jgi:hypothetical protein
MFGMILSQNEVGINLSLVMLLEIIDGSLLPRVL